MLREEFPDVTISKIRFLESQGLVNPERSPSGYRKFFETDVERLRWVLRQQREHFLPLKVIRDRLAAGDLGDDGVDFVDGAGPPEEIDVAEVAAEVPDPVRRNGRVGQSAQRAVAAPVGAGPPAGSAAGGGSRGGLGSGTRSWSAETHSGGNGAADTEANELTQADNEAMARILADASRRAALLPDPNVTTGGGAGAATGAESVPGVGSTSKSPAGAGNGPERTPLRVVEDPDKARPAAKAAPVAAAVAPAVPGRTASAAGKSDAAATSGSGRAAERASAPATAAPTALRSDVAAKSSEATSMATGAASGGSAQKARESASTGAGAAGASGAPSVASAATMSGMVSGASLTSDELCAASGLSEIELAGLQGFGLIEGEVVAGILTFNEDALTVANLASQFRKFGIEPRHLKQYRNAVDREMGLIEQVIIPLLRQRNPESRQRAVEGADELAGLGQTMRAALLRASLRRHLGG